MEPHRRYGRFRERDSNCPGEDAWVRVPEGAWVVDASGKTVYPGFIDAMTDLGHPPARNARQAAAPMGPFGPQGPIDPSTWSWGPEDRPGTHSTESAADGIDKADARIAQWRNAGFTTVVSALDDGLVTGQAAVLDLGDYERGRGMVVATPVAMRLKLQDRTYQGYPQSLLGSFAYLKQLYLDAQYGAGSAPSGTARWNPSGTSSGPSTPCSSRRRTGRRSSGPSPRRRSWA